MAHQNSRGGVKPETLGRPAIMSDRNAAARDTVYRAPAKAPAPAARSSSGGGSHKQGGGSHKQGGGGHGGGGQLKLPDLGPIPPPRMTTGTDPRGTPDPLFPPPASPTNPVPDPGNMRGAPDPMFPPPASPTSAAGPSREELARLVTSPMDRIDATLASSWKNRPWWLGGGG
jgi:hypothetical protein